jgi:hypothetical protein
LLINIEKFKYLNDFQTQTSETCERSTPSQNKTCMNRHKRKRPIDGNTSCLYFVTIRSKTYKNSIYGYSIFFIRTPCPYPS